MLLYSWVMIIGILIYGTLVYLVPFAARKREERQLQNYCRESGIIVLSYDDGPGPYLTRKLLKLFEEEQIRATFFFLGLRAVRCPELVQQAQLEGHEIGSHGQDHLNHWKVTARKARKDIEQGFNTLSSALSKNVIFRPPYGKLTLWSWLRLRRMGIRLGWWTFVSGDTCANLEPIGDVVMKLAKANGGVVLMHDFDRGKKYEDYVLDLTKSIILFAKKRNLRIKALGEVIAEIAEQ